MFTLISQEKHLLFDFAKDQEIVQVFKRWGCDEVITKLLKDGAMGLRKIYEDFVFVTILQQKTPELAGTTGFINRFPKTKSKSSQKEYSIWLTDSGTLNETLLTFIHELVHIALFQTNTFCAMNDRDVPENREKERLLMEEFVEFTAEVLIERHYKEILSFFKEKVEYKIEQYVFSIHRKDIPKTHWY